MSVYKEFVKASQIIEKNSKKIYTDSVDFGAPAKKGDDVWNAAATLSYWYGDKTTRKEVKYSTGTSVEIEVTFIDEWAVSDGEKSVKQATTVYMLEFHTCKEGACKGFEGFVHLYPKHN